MTLAELLQDADNVVTDDALSVMVDVCVTNDVGDPDILTFGERLDVTKPV